MILLRDYNEEKRLDRAWYSSSNVFYSECEDRENDFKVLRVVFNNGATYQYKDVDVNDYIMFMHGGLDGSNGKALNEFVKKKKYEYERIADSDKNMLTEEMNKLIEERKESLTVDEQQTETENEEQ